MAEAADHSFGIYDRKYCIFVKYSSADLKQLARESYFFQEHYENGFPTTMARDINNLPFYKARELGISLNVIQAALNYEPINGVTTKHSEVVQTLAVLLISQGEMLNRIMVNLRYMVESQRPECYVWEQAKVLTYNTTAFTILCCHAMFLLPNFLVHSFFESFYLNYELIKENYEHGMSIKRAIKNQIKNDKNFIKKLAGRAYHGRVTACAKDQECKRCNAYRTKGSQDFRMETTKLRINIKKLFMLRHKRLAAPCFHPILDAQIEELESWFDNIEIDKYLMGPYFPQPKDKPDITFINKEIDYARQRQAQRKAIREGHEQVADAIDSYSESSDSEPSSSDDQSEVESDDDQPPMTIF